MRIILYLLFCNFFIYSDLQRNQIKGNIYEKSPNFRILNNDSSVEISQEASTRTSLKTSFEASIKTTLEKIVKTSISRNLLGNNSTESDSESELLLLGTSDFKILTDSIHFFIFIIFNQGKKISESLKLNFDITYQNGKTEEKEIECSKLKDLKEVMKYNCSIDKVNNVKILKMNDKVEFNRTKPKKVYFSTTIKYVMPNLIEYNEKLDLDTPLKNGIYFYKNGIIIQSEIYGYNFFSIFAETESDNQITYGLIQMISGSFYSDNGKTVDMTCLATGSNDKEIEIDCTSTKDFVAHMNNTIVFSNIKSFIITFKEKDDDFVNITFPRNDNSNYNNDYNKTYSNKTYPSSSGHKSSDLKSYIIVLIVTGAIIIVILFFYCCYRCYKKRKFTGSDSQSNSSQSTINPYDNNDIRDKM